MKKILSIVLMLLCFWLQSKSQNDKSLYLSPEQAKADVTFFENIFFSSHLDLNLVTDTTKLRYRLDTLREGITDSIGPVELFKRLGPVYGSIRDIHCSLAVPLGSNDYYQAGNFYLPLNVFISDGAIYVCNDYFDSLPQGARILSINDVPADSIVLTLMDISSSEGDNIHSREKIAEYFFPSVFPLFFTVDSLNIFSLEQFQDTFTQSLPGVNRRYTEYDDFFQNPVAEEKRPFLFGYTQDMKIAYMRITTFMGGNPGEYVRFLNTSFRYLNDHPPQSLILDLRHNGGGLTDYGKKLLRYLMPEPFTYIHNIVSRSSPILQREILRQDPLQPELTKLLEKTLGYKPIRTLWKSVENIVDTTYDKMVKPVRSGKRFSGFLVVIIDGMSASTTGLVTNILSKRSNTVIAGQPAGCTVSGTFGQPVGFELPYSGIIGQISTLRFNQSNCPSVLTPIQPDIGIPVTRDDILTDRDDQLDAVVRFLREKMKQQ